MKYLVLLIIIRLCFGALHPVIKQENELKTCVNKIVSENYNKNVLLIQYDYEINLLDVAIPIIRNTNDANLDTIMQKYQIDMFLIFFIGTENDVIGLIEKIKKHKYWNSRAKFVICFQQLGELNFNLLNNIFEIFWKYYIFNVIILQQNDLELYTYFPYNFESKCGNNITSKYILNCLDLKIIEYFLEKIPEDLNKCNVTALSILRPPYVVKLNGTGFSAKESGFEVTILHTAAKKLNFTVVYLHNPYPDNGYMASNGTYIMMYEMIHKNIANLMFNALMYNATYYWDFHLMHFSTIAKGYWWVPCAGRNPLWENMIYIFNKRLWFTIMCTVFANSFAWWVFESYFERNKTEFSYYFINTWAVLMIIPNKKPKHWILKACYYVWVVSCLILTTLYTSQLVSVLTKAFYGRQITTVDEMLASGIKFGFHPGFRTLYNDSLAKERYILRNYVPCSAHNECINRTAYQKDFAVMKNDKQILNLIPRYWTDSSGRTMICPVMEYVITSLVG